MASSTPNGSSASHSSKFLAKLHDQIAQGKYSDLIIRVRIRPADEDDDDDHHDDDNNATAKRPRKDQECTNDTNAYADIPALSAILCIRSEYFEKALSGDWVEATERIVEVVVQSQQGLEDLKLLLKLSCMDNYTHDDGTLLPFATRMRLAVLADSFMFADAVDEIVASLPLDISFKEAVDCCVEGRVPDALERHPGMAKARKAMVQTLVDGINKYASAVKAEQGSETVVTGVQVLAELLGPVAGFFQGDAKHQTDKILPLNLDLLFMPFYTFKRILESDKLQLTSENDAYTLLTARVTGTGLDDGGLSGLDEFKKLAKILRYHQMSPDFLATVVSQCPLMKASGLIHSVMHASFAHHGMTDAARGLGNRGMPPSAAVWEVQALFSRVRVKDIKPGDCSIKWCSIVAGYPAYMYVERRAQNDQMGVFLGIQFPEQRHCDVVGALATGVHLRVWMTFPSLGLEKYFPACYQPNGTCWGPKDGFDMSWADATREDSPLFPDGVMEVLVRVEYAQV